MGQREASRRWRLARAASVREEEEDGRLGREGGLGRPRGRGPVGRGRSGRLKKKWVMAGPKGRLAARLIGPKVKEIFFSE
jgi:hypothetical protein